MKGVDAFVFNLSVVLPDAIARMCYNCGCIRVYD